MQRRRELMAMQTDGLPSAYRRVEYLQSSGGQCIVTDIIPDMTTDIVIANADLDYSNHNITMSVFGSMGANIYNAAGYTTLGHKFYAQVGGGNAYKVVENGVTTPGKHKFILNCVQKIFVVDDTVLSLVNLTFTSSSSPYNLFCQTTSGSYVAFMYGKIYDIKFVGKGNFIPCVRKSDNKPGMYDTVSKTFYTNAGTGEFIVPA